MRVVTACIFLAGVINFLPLLGVISADRAASSYGVDLSDPTLELLIRHRAVLFGLLGGFMLLAAFRTELHWFAIIGGLASMVSFILLAWQIGDYSAKITPIIYADIAGSGLLLVAAALKFILR